MLNDSATELAALGRERNLVSAEIGRRRAAGEPAEDLIQRNRELSARIKALQAVDKPCDPRPTGPRTTVITEIKEFAALRDEWNELLDSSAAVTPFMRWEWLYTWWEHFGTGKQLRIITSRDAQGVLIGIAPMMLGLRQRGRVNRRVLAFIGTGEVAEGDYFSLLLGPGHETDALESIWGQLADSRSEYDTLALCDVDLDAPLQTYMATCAIQHGRVLFAEPRCKSVLGPLPPTFEQFLATMPDGRRRRHLRSIEREGDAAAGLECLAATGADKVSAALQTLGRFSTVRQSAKGQVSAWCSPAFVGFMGAVCERCREIGALRVDLLVRGRETLAVQLGFVYKSTYFSYQMGFAPNEAALSPMHRLLGYRIRQSITERHEVFDFLPDEHYYKTEYFAGRKTVGRIWIVPNRPDAMLRLGGAIVSQALRRQVKAWLRRGG